jgi:hypothetical protein
MMERSGPIMDDEEVDSFSSYFRFGGKNEAAGAAVAAALAVE